MKTFRITLILLAILSLFAVFSQRAAGENHAVLSYWMITVRGGELEASVTCDNAPLTSVTHLGLSTDQGWNKYTLEADLDGCSEVTVSFNSWFPNQSLGWKIKGVQLHHNDIDLIENGCFGDGLGGWTLPSEGWSLSVDGGTKNNIPEDCNGGYAAKHGPIQFNGSGTAYVNAEIYQTVNLGTGTTPTITTTGTITPQPTFTATPTATPEVTPTPTETPDCFYNHCTTFLPIIRGN